MHGIMVNALPINKAMTLKANRSEYSVGVQSKHAFSGESCRNSNLSCLHAAPASAP